MIQSTQFNSTQINSDKALNPVKDSPKSTPRKNPQKNPYMKMKIFLEELGVLQNLSKLASFSLPPLNEEEKKLLLDSYNKKFSHKVQSTELKLSIQNIFEELIKKLNPIAINHCGSGPFKIIARTYFLRIIQEAYSLISDKELEVGEELLELLDEVCSLYCVKTDDDFRIYYSDKLEKPAHKAHNFYLELLADLCDSTSYDIQKYAFRKLHHPSDDDSNRFGLHTIGDLDIIDVVDLTRETIYKKGAGKIMVIPLLTGDIKGEIRPDSYHTNPWEFLFEIITGSITHGEFESKTRIFEFRDLFKLWTEMVKGLTPRHPELSNTLIDCLLKVEGLDIADEADKFFHDHLPENSSSGTAFVLQALVSLSEHPCIDAEFLVKFVRQTKKLWAGGPCDNLFSKIKPDTIQSLLSYFAIQGWLQSSDQWQIDGKTFLQLKLDEEMFSYVTIPFNLEEPLKHPEFIESLPPFTEYSSQPSKEVDQRLFDPLLESDDLAIRRLGAQLTLHRLRHLETPEPPSPYFYRCLLSLNLTENELEIVESYHPGIELSQHTALTLAASLFRTRDRRYSDVIRHLIQKAFEASLPKDYLFEFYTLIQKSEHTHFFLEQTVLKLIEGTFECDRNQDIPYLIFVSRLIGVLIIKGNKPLAAKLFQEFILPSKLTLLQKLKILEQMTKKGVTVSEEILIDIQKFDEIDDHFHVYFQCLENSLLPLDVLTLMKPLIKEYRLSPSYEMADTMAKYCSKLIELKDDVYEFWLFANQNSLWTAVSQCQEEYMSLISELFKYYYTANSMPPAPLHDEINERACKAVKSEIGDLQFKYLLRHPNQVSEPLHTSCLTSKHRRHINLQRIKELLDDGHIQKALNLTSRLKRVEPKLIAYVEKLIMSNPQKHVETCHSKELRLVYKKAKLSPTALQISMLIALVQDDYPIKKCQELLVCILRYHSLDISEKEFIEALFKILEKSDKKDFPVSFLKKFTKFFPTLLNHLKTQSFNVLEQVGVLARFGGLGHVTQGESDFLLTLCLDQVGESPILVESIVSFLQVSASPILFGQIALKLSQQYRDRDLDKAIAWLERSQQPNDEILEELIIDVSRDRVGDMIAFFSRCLLLTENVSIVERVIDKLIEGYTPEHPPEELKLLSDLYKKAPNNTELDKTLSLLLNHLGSTEKALSKAQSRSLVPIVVHLVNNKRWLFTPDETSAPYQGRKLIGFDFFNGTDSLIISYISTLLPLGTSEEKQILVNGLLGVPSLHLKLATIRDILKSAMTIDGIDPLQIIHRAKKQLAVYDGPDSSESISIDYFLADLYLRTASADSVRMSCFHLTKCFAFKKAYQHLKSLHYTFRISDLYLLLCKWISSLTLEEIGMEDPERGELLLSIAKEVQPAQFNNHEKLIELLSLLQKYCHLDSIEIQLHLLHQIIGQQPKKKNIHPPQSLKNLVQETVRTVTEFGFSSVDLYLSLSEHSTMIHYLLDDHHCTTSYLLQMLNSTCEDVIRRVPGYLKQLFGRKKCSKREDWENAVKLRLAESKRDQDLIETHVMRYVERELGTKENGTHSVSQMIAFPHLTKTLFSNKDFESYKSLVHKMLHYGDKPHLTFSRRLYDLAAQLTENLNIGLFLSKRDNHETIKLLIDCIYKKLCQSTETYYDYHSLLVDLAIIAVCSGNQTLINDFGFTRFCKLLQDQEGYRDLPIFKQLSFFQWFFDDGLPIVINLQDKDEFELIAKCLLFPYDGGIAIAIFLLGNAGRLTKVQNPSLYQTRCCDLYTRHAITLDSPTTSKTTIDTCLRESVDYSMKFLNQLFGVHTSELLDTFYDLFQGQPVPHDFYIIYYGYMLTNFIPNGSNVDLFFQHLEQYSKLKLPLHSLKCTTRLQEQISHCIALNKSLDTRFLDSLTSFLEKLILAPKKTIEWTIILQKIITDLMSLDNFSELEEKLAPYLCYLYNTQDLVNMDVSFPIFLAQEQLLLKLASTESASSPVTFIMIQAILADYSFHQSKGNYDSLVKVLSSSLSKSFKTALFLTPHNSENWKTYGSLINTMLEEPETLYHAPSYPIILKAQADLIKREIEAGDLQGTFLSNLTWSFQICYLRYQTFLKSDDYDNFFQLAEMIIPVLLIRDAGMFRRHMTDSSSGFSLSFMSLIEVLTDPRMAVKIDTSYYDRLFLMLLNIIKWISEDEVILPSEVQSTILSFRKILLKNIPNHYRNDEFKRLVDELTFIGGKVIKFNSPFRVKIKEY